MSTQQDALRKALENLENANDELCRLRTSEMYLAMLNAGQQDALMALDDARLEARKVLAALASRPAEAPAGQGAEDNPVDLWARIHRLEAEAKGPEGFATWRDAAVAERVRRVKAEKAEAMALDAALEEAAKVIAATHVIAGRQWHAGTALALQAELIEAVRALKSPTAQPKQESEE